MQANGGEVRDWKSESGSRMCGDSAEAGEDKAPARKVNDLQSSTDTFNRKTGFITRLGARENAVGASSRTEASEQVDQTMQDAAADSAVSDAAGGSAPMEVVEDLFRCDCGPRLTPTQQLPLKGFRMLTDISNQVDGRHCCIRAPRG
jgi:hypothetical protein